MVTKKVLTLLKEYKKSSIGGVTMKDLKNQSTITAAEEKKLKKCEYEYKVNRMTWVFVDVEKAIKALTPAKAKAKAPTTKANEKEKEPETTPNEKEEKKK